MERFLQDIRFAARSLRRNRVFSVVAIATFALGIGANTAIFSILNAVLLRPLPYPDSAAIVHLNLVWKSGDVNNTLTVPEFEFYRDHNGAFQALAGLRGGGTVFSRPRRCTRVD
jgi:putative ABC transport system permease protein